MGCIGPSIGYVVVQLTYALDLSLLSPYYVFGKKDTGNNIEGSIFLIMFGRERFIPRKVNRSDTNDISLILYLFLYFCSDSDPNTNSFSYCGYNMIRCRRCKYTI